MFGDMIKGHCIYRVALQMQADTRAGVLINSSFEISELIGLDSKPLPLLGITNPIISSRVVTDGQTELQNMRYVSHLRPRVYYTYNIQIFPYSL